MRVKKLRRDGGQTEEMGTMGMRIEVGEGRMGGEWPGRECEGGWRPSWKEWIS